MKIKLALLVLVITTLLTTGFSKPVVGVVTSKNQIRGCITTNQHHRICGVIGYRLIIGGKYDCLVSALKYYSTPVGRFTSCRAN